MIQRRLGATLRGVLWCLSDTLTAVQLQAAGYGYGRVNLRAVLCAQVGGVFFCRILMSYHQGCAVPCSLHTHMPRTYIQVSRTLFLLYNNRSCLRVEFLYRGWAKLSVYGPHERQQRGFVEEHGRFSFLPVCVIATDVVAFFFCTYITVYFV